MRYLIHGLQNLNWSLRHKVGLAFYILLICFSINGIISISLLLNIQQNEEKQREDSVYLERLQRIDIAYQSELYLFSDAIFYTKLKFPRNQFRDIIAAEFKKDLSGSKSAENKDAQTKIARSYANTLVVFLSLENKMRDGKFDEAAEEWVKSRPNLDATTNIIQQEKDKVTAEKDIGNKTLEQSIFISISIIVGLTFFSILLVVFIIYLFKRVILMPLNKIQNGLDDIARGNLNQQIKVKNRDEVGKLAESFSTAVISLQRVINGVQIGESLKKVTRELSVVSQQQTSGTQAQVSALTQVITTMQELSDTAGQIAENAEQVADLTLTTMEQVEKVAETGKNSRAQSEQMVKVVETTLIGVERVSEQVNSFSQVVVELQEKSANIDKVVQLLNSIADDIHLLALNASIEAAGAGEYGERFRVVAREIKQLAGRANYATREARLMITDVQESGRIAQEQVEQGKQEVVKIVEFNTGLRENLQSLESSAIQVETAVAQLVIIAGNVSSQTDMIRQATLQQRAASEQAIVAVRSAGEVTGQNALATRQIAYNSTELEQLTDQLNGVLSQVKFAA